MKKIIPFLVFFASGFGPHAQTATKTYVKVSTARNEYTSGSIDGLAKEDVIQEIQYYDGLGRPDQLIQRRASPSGLDIVSAQTYDAFGRPFRNYLPYERNQTTGNYRLNWLSEVDIFYGNTTNQTVDENDYYYAETRYEASPLGRITETLAPGADWVGANRGVEQTYQIAVAPYVIRGFAVDMTGLIAQFNYSALSLWMSNTIDEHGVQATEYITKTGQVVCRRQKVTDDNYLYESAFATTYYIYDDFGLLRFVLQPEGSKLMTSNPALLNDSDFRAKWMFRYEYDERRRMIEKQVPGAEPVYMVYDDRDRLVLTQDGNQRALTVTAATNVTNYQGHNYQLSGSGSVILKPGFQFAAGAGKTLEIGPNASGHWLFTKYDVLNRPIATGVVRLPGTQAEVQAVVDAFYVNTANSWHETHNEGSHQGYSNLSFPKAHGDGATLAVGDFLSFTYYDNYGFTAETAPTGAMSSVKGQVTGTKIRTLGAETFLTSVSWYDDRYRVLRTKTENHLVGTDQTDIEYYNKVRAVPKKQTRTHSVSGQAATTIVEEYDYDHMERLKSTTHKIGTQATVTLNSQNYNELGQLREKNIGKVGTGAVVQSVDYAYNIRGWLATINGGSGTFDDAADKFGMELQYNTAGQYNGNIGKMLWKAAQGSGTAAAAQSYNYTYDKLNRLTAATYNTGLSGAGHYNVSGITYDHNGNILTLTRKHNHVNADNLDYDYTGNQLTTVGDSYDNSLFDEALSEGKVANEYRYDRNGNMIQDLNKGLTAITYNHLNLPAAVSAPEGVIYYTYNAAGQKLRKFYDKTSGTDETTDYIGGVHYKNNVLDFIQHAEGRARKNGSTYEYEYNLTDHLGNVRVTVSSTGSVIQRDDYYPFGGTFNSYTSGTPNKYLYNGMELQDETQWYMPEEFRTYDPWLGRFMQIDPVIKEHESPYAWNTNNPITYPDPLGSDGDYFDEQGNHLGNDGIDDNKVHLVYDNAAVSSNSEGNIVVNEGVLAGTQEIGTRDDFLDLNGYEISDEGTKNDLIGLSINMKTNGVTEDYATIKVSDGDRGDVAENKSKGGATGSRHLFGDAGDIYVEGMSNKTLARAADKSGLFSHTIYYPDRGDTGNFKRHEITLVAGKYLVPVGIPVKGTRRNLQTNGPHVHVDNGPRVKPASEYTGHNKVGPTFKSLK